MSKDIEKQLNQILTRLDNLDNTMADLSDRLTNVEQGRSSKSLFQSAIETPARWLTMHDPQNGGGDNLRIANNIKQNGNTPYTNKVAHIHANLTKREFSVLAVRDLTIGFAIAGGTTALAGVAFFGWPWQIIPVAAGLTAVISYTALVVDTRYMTHKTINAATDNNQNKNGQLDIHVQYTDQNGDPTNLAEKLNLKAGITTDQLRNYGIKILAGKDMTVGAWVGDGMPFKRPQYDYMMSELKLLNAIIDSRGSNPRRPNRKGKAILRAFTLL